MAWCRAVWSEGCKTVEGVLSSTWIIDNTVHWPRKNAAKLASLHAVPAREWKKFPLQKIKCRADSRADCEAHNETSTEADDDQPCADKRFLKRKRYDDFIAYSDVEALHSEPERPHGISLPTPPKKSRPAAHKPLSSTAEERRAPMSSPAEDRAPMSMSTQAEGRASLSTPAEGRAPGSTQAAGRASLSTPAEGRAPGSTQAAGRASMSTPAEGRAPMSNDRRASASTLACSCGNDKSKLQKRILLELAKLGTEVRQLRNLVERQSVDRQYSSSTEPVIAELSAGPVATLDEYRSLQERCCDPATQTSLFTLLRRTGGNSTQETVKAVLSRLFSNFTMSYLSLDGRSYGKEAFRNTPVCRVVVDAVQHQHVDATAASVLQLISKHLKMAPHRRGGAGKGCHIPAFDDEPSATVGGSGAVATGVTDTDDSADE